MDKTFEQSKEEIAKLCEHFNINRDEFRACNEAFKNARVTTADAEQTTVAAFRPWRGS